MNLNDLFTEEKVRLDPKCWTGKKIGNPKTKVKGGVRVNNCVPAESVSEDIGDLGYNVVRYYEKTQEVKKLTNWLEKEAGLPRNSPLYFDDVDLVYGNKTIVPGALINPKLTFNDLLTAVVQASKQGMVEATGDEKFDTMMGRIQQEPKYPDSQMPPTDIKDLYDWAVENNKLYHEIFAEWANREGYKSVAPALQRAGDLDTEALDYWTPRVWKIYWGEVRGIDSEMPPEWAKKRVPDELRDYLETVFDAYNRIVFDWPTEYRQIGQQGMAEAQTDYQKRRQRERDVDAGKPVKPPPKNPQNDYFARRKKERDMAEGVMYGAENLHVGDDVIISGDVNLKGATGVIDSFGQDNRFVVVNLYNHGKHSFHSSDVSANDHDNDEHDDDVLDEKSVSQSQFRTMAGAAHNPEFARKVGISQDVAKEFHSADKHSNYKKLPDRTTEGEQQKGADYRDPKEVDYDDEYDAMVARVKKLAGLGPMKTVYDPKKRQYRNMPTAQQPKK